MPDPFEPFWTRLSFESGIISLGVARELSLTIPDALQEFPDDTLIEYSDDGLTVIELEHNIGKCHEHDHEEPCPVCEGDRIREGAD